MLPVPFLQHGNSFGLSVFALLNIFPILSKRVDTAFKLY